MTSNHETPDENFTWTDARLRQLISLVKLDRRLWHNSVEGFTGNPVKRVELFVEIANQIGTTAFEANRRFTTLRERYGRESKKLQMGKQDIQWPYFEDMNFLKEVIRRRDKRKSGVQTIKKEEIDAEEEHSLVDDPLSAAEYMEMVDEEDKKGSFPQEKRTFVPKMMNETPEPTQNRTVFLMTPEEAQKELDQDEAVEAAFKYFTLELRKMDQMKREYCIDKMMMAFINAKSTYPH
ncbi:uncharacterized protein LOC134834882 [Culicoides brevitarsis]|uniref:uncharacterized protein LOC134834882 n=1 Tax=Culicoides brevitarsis TaxID=469753 RepID=UPI00307BB0D9